jgi:hypothetical protein
MIHAEYGVKLPFMLDDHAGAKLCGFCAAHNLPIKCSFGNFAGRPHFQKAREITRGMPEQLRR